MSLCRRGMIAFKNTWLQYHFRIDTNWPYRETIDQARGSYNPYVLKGHQTIPKKGTPNSQIHHKSQNTNTYNIPNIALDMLKLCLNYKIALSSP